MRSRIARASVALLALLGAGLLLAGCGPPPVTLAGSLTRPGGGAVAGVEVSVYADGAPTLVARTATDTAGAYSFRADALPAGTYRVRFSDGDWWSGAGDWAAATPVTVTTDAPTVVNESVEPSTGSISGTVTAGVTPLSGATVEAISVLTGAPVRTTTSGAGGTYAFGTPSGGYLSGALATGSYRIRFSAAGKTTRFSGSVHDLSNAPVVSVTAGGSVTGVDASLDTESSLTGKVLAGKAGVPGLTVTAVSATTGDPVSSTSTAADGGFSVGRLNPDGYRLVVSDPSGALRTTTWGAPAAPLGTVLTPPPAGSLDAGTQTVVGVGCDPSVFTPGANLAGKNLSGLELRGCDLSGDDLSGADLSGSDLRSARLTGADLGAADLSGVSLFRIVSGGVVGTPASLPAGWTSWGGYLIGPGADLTAADLTGAPLAGLDLSAADLSGADLANAAVGGTSFVSATAVGVRSGGLVGLPAGLPSVSWHLVAGYLVGPGADLSGAELAGADLYSDLTGANFSGADLVGASLQFTLTGADFSGADLRYAHASGSFTNVDVEGALLTGLTCGGTYSGGIQGTPAAQGSGCVVVNGYLVGEGAQLSDADLHGADLHGLDLRNTSLFRANLSGAQLFDVRSGQTTTTGATLPDQWTASNGYLVGPGAVLEGITLGQLSNVNLSSADLRGATLYGLTSSTLAGADLTGATLEGLTNVDLTGTNLSHVTLQSFASSGLVGTPVGLPPSWRIVRGYLLGPDVLLDGNDLSGLDLTGVDLTGAGLYSVNITGTRLAGTVMTGVGSNFLVGTPASLPPGSTLISGKWIGPGAILLDANLAGLDLSGVDLANADLRGANLSGVTGSPTGGSTALYENTVCPDATVVSAPLTCVGHGLQP